MSVFWHIGIVFHEAGKAKVKEVPPSIGCSVSRRTSKNSETSISPLI